MRRLAPRLLDCAWLLAGAAQAHPYTIEDLLSRQSLGPVTLSPKDAAAPAFAAAEFRFDYRPGGAT